MLSKNEPKKATPSKDVTRNFKSKKDVVTLIETGKEAEFIENSQESVRHEGSFFAGEKRAAFEVAASSTNSPCWRGQAALLGRLWLGDSYFSQSFT